MCYRRQTSAGFIVKICEQKMMSSLLPKLILFKKNRQFLTYFAAKMGFQHCENWTVRMTVRPNIVCLNILFCNYLSKEVAEYYNYSIVFYRIFF